jgi:alpha-N-arabinofuranosidase
MNRREFLIRSTAATTAVQTSIASAPLPRSSSGLARDNDAAGGPRVAVLLVDTDRAAAAIDQRIYGHFLEHINHSVDGLFAEQIRGCGFEGEDFSNYWQPFSDHGRVDCVDGEFSNGKKCVRLHVDGGSGRAGIRQDRIFVEAGREYDGSLLIKDEAGSPRLALRVVSSSGQLIASVKLTYAGSNWQEVRYSFSSHVRDTQASVEIAASGSGTLLVDFISMMRADVRRDGMIRPDLLEALRHLAPPFIRWPGGSFASTYKWKDGIGPHVSRRYHPNIIWGGYSDYYGFGTEEFMGLCRKLGSQPLIVLPANSTDPEQVQYAMDWVHYLNDPPTTVWGRLRASNGHPEPYGVRYFQIDNEPMNLGFTPEMYADVVNLYGSRLRSIAPEARIVACGQKRSNDMVWSEKVIDVAGKNFDILGVHNYEYEPDNFETGLRRIRDYLLKLCDYVRASAHPQIEIGVLEWNLSRTYDWRAGLHAAGSLMLYEELSPTLAMSCPALLMRNTTDDPTWTSLIYHDHVSWFPGSAYPVEKLFRAHYAERRLASTSGVFRDIPKRATFFTEISTMKPEGWQPGTVDAIATGSTDGRQIVIKAVNYGLERNALLVRLQGTRVPANAVVKLHTISAGPKDCASLQHPDAIAPVSRTLNYAMDLTVNLDPYTVAVVEILGER